MSFSKRDIIILIVGLCGLSLLGFLTLSKFRHIPPAASSAAEKPIVPEVFTQKRVFCMNGLIFATDRKNKSVIALVEKTGALVWESQGEDRLIIPGAAFPIDLSPSGELWVANVGKKRLEQLDPKTGRFIASWQPQKPFSGCCNPVRFAALSRGRFVTMEKGTRRACVYLPSGELEQVLTDSLSSSEYNYYLYHTDEAVYLFDAGTSRQRKVPYE